MRYFLQLSYKGTRYHGWQRQANALTIQEKIEQALETLVKEAIPITGCGRTDAGVHASNYYAHLDLADSMIASKLVHGLNGLVGEDIVLHKMIAVSDQAHARFDAVSRTYRYHILFRRNPFLSKLTYFYRGIRPDIDKLNQSAYLLTRYEKFFPFCKAHSDVKDYRCTLEYVGWKQISKDHYVFEITANRFLRGMVRLITGMCLQVAEGKLDIRQVQQSLDRQERLPRDWSVPGQGLYLTEVRYPASMQITRDIVDIFP